MTRTAVRSTVWDEIQSAIVEAERLRRWPGMTPLERDLHATMSSGHIYATLQGYPPRCVLCDHEQEVHSKILPFEPCLDCDCVGWTVLTLPNPSRRSTRRTRY